MTMNITGQDIDPGNALEPACGSDVLLQGLADAARACSGYPIAAIVLQGRIRVVSQRGIPVGIAERMRITSLARRVQERDATWIVDDLWNDAESLADAAGGRCGLRAVAAWPLHECGEVSGCLMVFDVIARLAQPEAFDALGGLAATIEAALAHAPQPQATERRYAAVFDDVPDGLLLLEADGRIAEANPAARALFGLAGPHPLDQWLCVDEARGVWVDDAPGPADEAGPAGQVAPRRMPAWRAGGGKSVVELRIDRPPGLEGLHLAVVRDVTRLDEARQLLELHALIVEKTESAVLILDPGLGIEWCNAGFERLSGFSIDELCHTSVERFFGSDQAPAAEFARLALSCEPFHRDFTWRARNGERFTIALEVHPIFDGTGQLGRLVALGFDVTEQRLRAQRKTDFVSMVSHELRAPLTVIRGTLDALAAGMVGELAEYGAEILELGQRNCERLSGLIEDLLEINQIENGLIPISPQRVSMSLLMRDAAASMRRLAQEAGVRLDLGAIVEPGTVNADPRRITQVLVNLLGNAIKFSQSGRPVELSSVRIGDSIRVRVADQGPGIPNAFKPRLFELFSREPGVAASGKEGFGLGLCISKGLVEHMGGQIGFDSEEGIGSTFYFDLPLVAAPHETPPVTVAPKDLTA